MKYNGDVELVYCDEMLFPMRVGYSLGTVYRVNPKTSNTYELLNFGYCPKIQEFYFNRNVNLPKKVVKLIESMNISKDSEHTIEEFDIYRYEDIAYLLNQYENMEKQKKLLRKKILNYRIVLGSDDK